VIFKTRKVLNIITNVSFIEIAEYNKVSFEACDRLDSNYTEMKAIQINNKTKNTIQTINNVLAKKLNELEKEKAVLTKTATSLSWLALLVASGFILITILNDLHKLFCFLKENSSFLNRKREKNKKPQTIERINKSARENVFKKVMAKDKHLFNHSYFQKRRNITLNVI
jgi:hypothetical protein